MKPIAIIDCATSTPSYNCMNRIVEKHQIPVTYHWVSKYGLDSLRNFEDVGGYIIFGSDSNVTDRLPWQRELALFIKEKIEQAIPTFGICFGHQLIADLYGAKIDLVTADNKCYEGSRKQEVLIDKLGFSKGTSYETVVTHHYELKSLPKNFVHLAKSIDCHYDAIAHQTLPYFSIQGHPEASIFFLKNDIEVSMTEEQIKSSFTGGDYIIKKFLELAYKK